MQLLTVRRSHVWFPPGGLFCAEFARSSWRLPPHLCRVWSFQLAWHACLRGTSELHTQKGPRPRELILQPCCSVATAERNQVWISGSYRWEEVRNSQDFHVWKAQLGQMVSFGCGLKRTKTIYPVLGTTVCLPHRGTGEVGVSRPASSQCQNKPVSDASQGCTRAGTMELLY